MHRVDIHEGQRVLAGQQRRPPGQLAQQFPVHRLQLADVSQELGKKVMPRSWGWAATGAAIWVPGP